MFNSIQKSSPENNYWVIPFEGEISSADYHLEISKAYSSLFELGFQPNENYEEGMLHLYKKNEILSYLFVSIEESTEQEMHPSIIRLPKRNYVTTRTRNKNSKNIPQEFPELFNQSYDKIVFQLEVFTKRMNMKYPYYEIRCSLPVKIK